MHSPCERPFRLRRLTTSLLLLASVLAGSAQEAPPTALAQVVRSNGPWGTIESYPVTLEPPATHLWEALYDERSYWNFGSMDQASSRALLVELGFMKKTLSLVDLDGVWKPSK